MFSVTSFRTKNLRSFIDSGYVDLKPITILVGRNSAGKSTIARIFPLLRQSIEVNKRGPLLWWGRLVDFGSFDEAINKFCSEKFIDFDFKISFGSDDFRKNSRRGFGRLSMFRTLYGGETEISIRLKNSEKNTYTSNIKFKIFDFESEIKLQENGQIDSIKCGSYIWTPSNSTMCFATQDRLIPNHLFFKKTETSNGDVWENFDPIQSELERQIRNFVHGNTAESRIRQLASRIPMGFKKDIFENLSTIADPSSFRDYLKSIGPDSIQFNSIQFTKLCEIALAANLDILLEQTNSALSTFANEVIYLEPLRATAQRYYRQQSLAVGEIDSKGENIAMYLDSLTTYQLRDFNKWNSKYFGVEVKTKRAGGHISINIKQTSEDSESNIADMGFGFSQVLPIAAQLWSTGTSPTLQAPIRQKSTNPVIAIEQPELHLHPEYQSILADILIATTEKNSNEPNKLTSHRNIKIIAETHSPALINRLGTLVADGSVDKKDIQIILIEQENSRSPSKIRAANFDDDGILRNWPIGFFEPTI